MRVFMNKFVLGLIFLGLVGCSESPEKKAASEKSMLEVKAQEVVKESLKDPESAEFRNMNGVCGEVNAKNSFGGYTGFKKFVIDVNASQLFIDPEDATDSNYGKFNDAWFRNCEKH